MRLLSTILFLVLAVDAAQGYAAPKSTPPETQPRLNLADRSLFPPELYPGLELHSPDDLLLAGLAAQYPGRIVRTPPSQPPPPLRPRDVLKTTLPKGVEYIRFRTGTRENTPTPTARFLIVDLRYFATGADSLATCVRLCESLTGSTPQYSLVGDYPADKPKEAAAPPPKDNPARHIVVLVNHNTSGPIEALLADLQARGKIILVGTPTPGHTAIFAPLKNHAGWWRVTGEIQPATNPLSLVGTGAIPRMRVQVAPDVAMLAWQRVENGSDPRALLRDPFPAAREDTATERISDPILRRGHDILVALQVMGDNVAPPATPAPQPKKPSS
jgi:hypothetical protein